MNNKLTLIFIIILISTSLYAQKTKESKELIRNINKLNTSKATTVELSERIKETIYLTRSWVFIDKSPEAENKKTLINLQDSKIPLTIEHLNALSINWTEANKQLYEGIKIELEKLIYKEKYVMNLLNSFESYNDPLTIFEVVPMVEQNGEVLEQFKIVELKLGILIKSLTSELQVYLPPLTSNTQKNDENPKQLLIKEYYFNTGIKDKISGFSYNERSKIPSSLYETDKEAYYEKYNIINQYLNPDSLVSDIYYLIDKTVSEDELHELNKMYRDPEKKKLIILNAGLQIKIDLYLLEQVKKITNE